MGESAHEQGEPDNGPQALSIRAVLQVAQETASVHPDARIKVMGPRPEDTERAELRWHGRRLGKHIVVQPSGADWSLKLEALAETDLLVLPRWATSLVLALRLAALPAVVLCVAFVVEMAQELWPWNFDNFVSALVVLAAAGALAYYAARPAGARTSLRRVIGPLAPAETEGEPREVRDLMVEAWEWLDSLTPLDVVNESREAESAVDRALHEYASAHGLQVKQGADRQWWMVGPRVRVEVDAHPLSEVVLSDRSPGRARAQGVILAWSELPRLGEHVDDLRARPDEEDEEEGDWSLPPDGADTDVSP